MIANMLVSTLALLSAAAPMAAARPVSSEALPVDTSGLAHGEDGVPHVAMRRLHQRKTRAEARVRRAEIRRKRDEEQRRFRLCKRTGNCGGSALTDNQRASFTTDTVTTVEEDDNKEQVSTPPPPPSPPPPPPAPTFAARRSFSPPPSEPRPSPSGDKWVVCVNGDKQSWGPMDGRKPEGVTVFANGRCELAEYAGGFDGYWSNDAGDGHEDGFASAVKGMLRDKSARVGASAGKQQPFNQRVNKFMTDLRDRTDPLDMDFPRDEAKADNGARMANIRKASAVCTQMIEVRRC